MAPLTLNLSADVLIQGLLQIAEYLDDAINFQDSPSATKLLATKIPLLDMSVGELLATKAEELRFDPHQILTLSPVDIVDGFKKFTTQLNLEGKTASSVGIKPDDAMTFLSTTGESFEAIVDRVDGEFITLKYDTVRSELPNTLTPLFQFKNSGKLSDQLKSALANYVSPKVSFHPWVNS